MYFKLKIKLNYSVDCNGLNDLIRIILLRANRLKIVITKKFNGLYFFHIFSISSNDLPLVSGTHFHTKRRESTLITP